MIIRESPLSKQSNPDTNWPPKSPHEVLLSSPSRMKRLQQQRDRSTSPTPSKRTKYDAKTPHGSSDEEEDEETLQLQLKAIEARLKLKKLQKAKQRASAGSEIENIKEQKQSETTVEVAHSPRPLRQPPQAPESPKRVLLGIDKGLRASDVSLKRARNGAATVDDGSTLGNKCPAKPVKSFNERLRDSRTEDHQRQEKEDHGKRARSKGFGILKPQAEISQGEKGSSTRSKAPIPEIQISTTGPDGGKGTALREGRPTSKSQFRNPSNIGPEPAPQEPSGDDAEDGDVDPHSGFLLSKRLIDEKILASGLAGKTVVTIPQLLKDIKSPDYDIPDFSTDDFVVIGIVASKSSPRDRATTHHTNSSADPDSNAQSKFMAITLTDLKWSLDLFLFDTGFARFWKLTVGTIIAILNPGIMPPKPHLRDTGRFSLKLSSSEDTVLELGMAQDLGFCKSLKKDGKECGQWIDKRKTEFCDFHVNLAIEKTTAGRMEINGMIGMGLFGIGGETGSNKRGVRGGMGARGGWRGGARGGKENHTGLKREGQYYDRNINETGYIIPPEFSTTRSAAKLLDSEDYVQGALSQKERSRKRLAAHEKERELSRKLAMAGSGMGLEYLRVKGRAGDGDKGGTGESGRRDEEKEGKLDATDLGLVGSRAVEVKLSPVKVAGRRRREDVGAQPMGWGGAFKRDLPTRKERMGINGGGSGLSKAHPVVSKDQGGRASTGAAAQSKNSGAAPADDDDDDDLDII